MDLPADVPEKPPQRTEPCRACKGRGTKPGRFLGSPDDPCPECAGSGWIEVGEPPLTAWQQEVSKLLRQILAYVELGVARNEAEDRTHPLDSPEVQAKCEQIIVDFLMKDRSP